jgi:hypothetical protein
MEQLKQMIVVCVMVAMLTKIVPVTVLVIPMLIIVMSVIMILQMTVSRLCCHGVEV